MKIVKRITFEELYCEADICSDKAVVPLTNTTVAACAKECRRRDTCRAWTWFDPAIRPNDPSIGCYTCGDKIPSGEHSVRRDAFSRHFKSIFCFSICCVHLIV